MNDKKLAIATPIILLAVFIMFFQVMILPHWIAYQQTGPAANQPSSGSLQVLGYNYNKDLVQVSVTLWNRGSAPLNITDISYDSVTLARGVVGSPNDLVNGTASLGPNSIVFPAADHWNLYTGGPTEPLMQPNTMATLYLGVSSTTPGSTHTLVIVSGEQQYALELAR